MKNFERSMLRLEEIVMQLESSALALDEAVKLYEEGVGLSVACKDALHRAELQLETLAQTEDGVMRTAIEEDAL